MKFCVSAILLLISYQSVNCATKKSWKSAANFDAEVPKFTPFDDEQELSHGADASLNEVEVKAPQPIPSPTAESLTASKISSKIKAPSKHIANIYSQLHKESQKQPSKDFGTFDANVAEKQPPKEPEHDADNQLGIEQVLNQLTYESDKLEAHNDSTDNNVEEDLKITTIDNVDTNTTQYKVGPLMNVTIDSEDSLVNVNLDQNTLKEIFTGSSSRAI